MPPLARAPDAAPPWLTWSSVVGFFGCGVLAVLVFLSVSALQDTEGPPAGRALPQADWAADFPERVEQVTAALALLPLPLPTPSLVPQGGGRARWFHRRYEATVPKPPASAPLARVFAPVRAAARGVTVDVSEKATGATVQIGVDGLLTHTIALHWLQHRARMAIIVDNLGSNLLLARALSGIDAPLTFAVRPIAPFSTQVAALAELFHREVLLSVSVAEEGEEGASAAGPPSGSRPAFARWLGNNLAVVPQAIGICGRFGVPLTRDPERVRWVLEEVKRRHLFLVEAGNPADPAPCDLARSMQIACAQNVVILDAGDDEGEIGLQLEGVLNIARTRGEAIAVVPALPSTVAALQSTLPSFGPAGVDLVPVSTIVNSQTLSPR